MTDGVRKGDYCCDYTLHATALQRGNSRRRIVGIVADADGTRLNRSASRYRHAGRRWRADSRLNEIRRCDARDGRGGGPNRGRGAKHDAGESRLPLVGACSICHPLRLQSALTRLSHGRMDVSQKTDQRVLSYKVRFQSLSTALANSGLCDTTGALYCELIAKQLDIQWPRPASAASIPADSSSKVCTYTYGRCSVRRVWTDSIQDLSYFIILTLCALLSYFFVLPVIW